MADSKISALTLVGTMDSADEFVINDGGVSKKATLQKIVDYIDSHRESFGVEPVCAVLAEAVVDIMAPGRSAARPRINVMRPVTAKNCSRRG